MAHEELSELSASLNQWRRGRIDYSKVEEEIADAFVILTGLLELGGQGATSRVAARVHEKALRLSRMVPAPEVPAPPKSLTTLKALEPAEPGLDGTFDFWR